MIRHFFAVVLLSGIANFSIQGEAKALSLPDGMQKLCAATDKDFIPAVESIISPNKNELFYGIELGSDFDETLRLLKGRHPDSVLILEDVTPLLHAVSAGNWHAARALLHAGANVNYYAPSLGSSVLDMATLASQFPMACKLIENGAHIPVSIDGRNRLFGNTLIMNSHSVEMGLLFMEFLISIGFDVNDYGSSRNTPLMTAVTVHNIPVIKTLLKHGARVDIVKQGERTVWTVAREKNNPQVIKLLKDAQRKASPRTHVEPQKETIQ